MKEALYDKEILCPVCNKKFKTKKVRSKYVKTLKRDADFCIHYKDVNPLYYSAFVCPHCGYASTEKNFGKLTIAQKSMIKTKISSRWNGKSYSNERSFNDAIEVHKLVLLNYNVSEFPNSEKGKLCLKLAWFYRYIESEKEFEYLKYAVNFLENAYTSEHIDDDPQNEVNILYLLGELNRRLGNYSKSIQWFQITLKNSNIKNFPTIEKLARDQWAEAKIEFTKSKKAE